MVSYWIMEALRAPSILQHDCLCPQDSESVDRYIQAALTDLYPPVLARSSSVLRQVLSVSDSCYQGDGLRYLLHFLLPAKHFLQNLQQDACVQYCGVLFCHDGWPLCIHEKIVIQLCPLDVHLLRPGDFYLQVSPPTAPPQGDGASRRRSGALTTRLLLGSVSPCRHHVEQQEVPAVALPSLFSMAWLDSVNRERERRGAAPLQRCVLSTAGDVFRVPWEDLVYPQLLGRPRASSERNAASFAENRDAGQESRFLPHSQMDQSETSSDGDSEGEYVELTELPLPCFSPQKGSLTQSISQQRRCAAQPAAQSTKQPAAQTTAQPAAQNATQPAAQTPTQPMAQNTTQPTAVAQTTAQPAAQTTTHPAVQNTTQPAAVPSHCDTNGSVTHQLTAVDAHSVETHSFSLHEERRFALGGEELLQDLRGAVTLTSYSSAPTVVEHTEGTKSHRRLNTADSCMEQEEEESVSVSDAEKEVKEEQLRERRWSDEEEEDESRGTGEEEVELEEEVRVIVVPQRQARKEEEAEAMKEEQHRGGTRQEKKHLTKDFYSEKHTQQTELRGSYCEENTQHSICEETQQKHTNSYLIYSENTNKIDPLHLYSENTTHHSYSQNFCSENSRNVENSNFDNTAQTQLPSSYCESVAPLTLPEESWDSRTGLCEEASTPPVTSSAVPPFIEKSNLRQKEEEGAKKEVQEERSCKEVGAGGATKRQSEGLCRVSVQLSSCSQTQSRLNCVLLNSGAVCLPGTADRGGRPLLTVCCSSAVWSHSASASGELLHLLLYYTSTLRKELRASGLTVLLDARKAAPPIVLLSALRALQEQAAVSIHSLLVLTHTDSCPCLDKPAATQVEVLTSVKSLQKHVELRQLPEQFGGSFSFNQSSWVTFRQRVELLINQCDDVINLLRKNINILHTTALPVSAQDAELLLSRYEAMMRDILGDSQLARLQQEGGASLLWLRRKEGGVAPAQRAAVEVATCLYEKVDELLHHLVALSNTRTQQLSFVVDFRGREDDLSQVSCWLKDFGETRLKLFEESEDSVELLVRKRQQFKQFYTTAQEYCRLGDEVLADLRCGDHVTSGDLQVFGVKVQVFTSELATFSQRLCKAAGNLQESERLYRFFDQAYSWALAGMRHLAGVTMDECMLPERCQAVISCLEEYYRQHPPIPDGRYQEMRASASKLRGERGLRQWSFAWSKCQETKKMFDRKMEAAVRTRDSALRQRSDSLSSRSSASSRKTLPDLFGVQDDLACSPEENASLPVTSMPKGIPLLQRLFRSASSEESSDRGGALSSPPSLPHLVSSPTFPTFSSFSSGRGPQLRKTQSSDCPFTPEMPRRSPGLRLHGEPQRRGNTGVFIRGLEVSSNETSDLSRCARTPAHVNAGSPTLEPQPRGSKLCHVVQELVCTEREYVRSLRYILHHYVPEMQSDDVPQELRGKRSLVFGNLHKLLDFHAQFFLRELEACWKHPHRVPHCFLRHQEQFGLYALYSKNKPKSDILLANHGHFFRRKQLELGDKMDLSSYLLKPIQRMSKYALLLCDLIKEVGVAQEAELAVLQSATSMVKFQLRHGNDLLAMDAIRDCDVNLKEQGQLVRQDHFTVWIGRRKSQRHIFLFEELVLFSKPKKVQGGLDLFLYKHSFKTADVGLTESTGDSGLRFEIWFRRRTSKNQTFILQASSAEVRQAWTGDIARILWTQATRNKEMRLKEMVSMGVGNKPFLDIQPSEAAISDRAVHYIMKSRGTRTRASIAVSAFDHAHPFTPGAVTSDLTASGPSSCSLLGPLNLHMFSQSSPSPPVAEGSISTSCIEEDEQEIEISSQRSMTTESSGSSSRCLSSSTGSDSGCISSNLQEALPEEPSSSDHRHMERFVHSSTESASTDHILRVPIEDAAAAVGPATVI